MRRLLAFLLIAVLALAAPSQALASITCEATGANQPNVADPSTINYTFPANSNQYSFLIVHDRAETNGITSISGGGCVWTLRAGPRDLSGAGANRQWMYEGAGCTPGAGTITADLTATTNTALAVGSCWSTTTWAFVSAGPSGTESTTNVLLGSSESVTFTNTGAMIAGFAFNNSVTIATVSTNSDDMTAAASRAQLVNRLESAGAFTIDITMAATAFTSQVLLYQESVAAGTGPTSMLGGVGNN